jgi:hypothetical protein
MSDLPRVIILWILDLFLPVHMVKFVYVLLTLVAGPVGVYFFLKYILRNKDKNDYLVRIAAFLASLFYFFNLITVQQFYVVFEMFAVQYAALGWLFYLITRYFEQGKTKLVFWFLLANFLVSPMAYAPLLWYVYFAGLTGYLFFLLIQHRSVWKQLLKRAGLVIAITLVANAYWLLPNLYYLASGAGQIPEQAHINRLFSDEAFLQNKMYGDLRDLALFKNFLFNWTVYSPRTGTQVPLLEVWQQHLPAVYITEIGYGLILISLLGLIRLTKQKNRYLIALVPIFFGAVFMLLNDNPPLGWLFRWLRGQAPILEEATRFPFTKFSLIFLLTTVSYFAFGVKQILLKLNQSKDKFLLKISFTVLIIVSLLSYSLPYFQGELISSKMENQIPQSYFELFNWFEKQPQGRILTLPMHTPYGWKYHTWGYEGAGFIWFGLDHPVLERDFDRWSPYNETLYEQLSHALYEQDFYTFKQLLDKYDIQYLLLDQSTTATENTDILWWTQTQKLLLNAELELVFEQDFLQVYQVPQNNELIYALSLFPKVHAATDYARKDTIYRTLGNYLSSAESQIYYPFTNLTQVRQEGVQLKQEQATNIIIERPWEAGNKTYYVDFDKLDLTNKQLTYQLKAEVDDDNQLIISLWLPLTVKINQDYLIEFRPLSRIFSFQEGQFKKENYVFAFNNAKFELSELLLAPIYITLTVDQPLQTVLFEKGEGTENISIYSEQIDLELWQQLRSDLNKQYFYQKQQDAEIKAEFITLPVTVPIAANNQINNCDMFKRGWVKKQIEEARATYIAADNGVACEIVRLNKVSNHQNYLLAIDAKTEQGRDLKLSLYNWQTGRSDLVELVENNGLIFYSILDWPLLPDNNYSLYLETRSFGSLTINQINSLNLYPYPIDIVSALRIKEGLFEPNSNDAVTTLNIVDEREIGTYCYWIKTRGDEGIVALSQSYDAGWLGISWNDESNITILPHSKLNGWANAWEVPAGKHSIYLVYWPQLLEFVGLGLLLMVVIYLGYKTYITK